MISPAADFGGTRIKPGWCAALLACEWLVHEDVEKVS
jgi:hypothetical protein